MNPLALAHHRSARRRRQGGVAMFVVTMMLTVLATVGLLVLASPVGWSADWPQFRGPDGTGVVDDPKSPAEWDARKNVAWIE